MHDNARTAAILRMLPMIIPIHNSSTAEPHCSIRAGRVAAGRKTEDDVARLTREGGIVVEEEADYVSRGVGPRIASPSVFRTCAFRVMPTPPNVNVMPQTTG